MSRNDQEKKHPVKIYKYTGQVELPTTNQNVSTDKSESENKTRIVKKVYPKIYLMYLS